MAAHRVSAADLERWVHDGLITSDQQRKILDDLEAHQAPEQGLDLPTLLYYGGGLLVLIAYSFFLGLQWEELDSGGRVAISALSFAFFAAASTVLMRFPRFRLPGELLQVVTVAIVPLLAFALLDAAGWWPADPGSYPEGPRQDYIVDLTLARMVLGGATLIAGVGAFYVSRSPFVLIAALIALGSIAIDLTLLADPNALDYNLETPQAVVIALLGAAAFVLGVALRGRTDRNYSIWLYLLGIGAMGQGLGILAFGEEATTAWGILWLIVSLMVVGLSIPLQERVLAGLGLAGVFFYLAHLVFDVFESATASLVLVAIGLLVLGAGMVYQRYAPELFPSEEPRGIT